METKDVKPEVREKVLQFELEWAERGSTVITKQFLQKKYSNDEHALLLIGQLT